MSRILLSFIFLFSFYGIIGQTNTIPSSIYICPPCNSACDNIEHTQPGACPHCNMVLIKKSDSKRIAFYLQDGVEVLDFAGPLEVFAYAGYEVFTVSATKSPITSQGILGIIPDYDIQNAPKADILAFFGGNAASASMNKDVIQWVKQQKDIKYHFSVCTGAFVLAEAGILDGKTATTFHNALDNLQMDYPNIDVKKNVRFVDNGKVITTAGISAGIDGALHLVAKLQGLNTAKRIAYHMEYDRWDFSDGLILSEDNPYLQQRPESDLLEYVGQYEFGENQVIEVRLNSENKDLYAVFDELAHPLYPENGDVFSDETNKPIHFIRDDKGNIAGYSRSKGGPLFKKL